MKRMKNSNTNILKIKHFQVKSTLEESLTMPL